MTGYFFGRAPIGSGFALQSFFAKIQGQKKDFRFNPSRSPATTL